STPLQPHEQTQEGLTDSKKDKLLSFDFDKPAFASAALAIPLSAEALTIETACTSCNPYIICGAVLAVSAYCAIDYLISHPEYINDAITTISSGFDFTVLDRNKEGSVDPSLPANPDELLNRPDWKETTHPDAGKKGHRTFENKETGEKIRHDEGNPGEPGHQGNDHYHRPNPNKTNWANEYLDGQGKPVPDGHDKAHIYSPDKVWWK
ncbi:MAG: hypothetical protein HW387_1773, partial [Parachlamydiales bacterium]|nr:hypothetical protein [Parachlamydiales bacterium]